jgi:sugar phosphate isomerase/epimerase
VVRFTDAARIIQRFEPLGMRCAEFHVSDRDLEAGPGEIGAATFPFGLVVHAPEYSGDVVLDLCSPDAAVRARSTASAQRVIDLARALAPRFAADAALFPRGPKVVLHVGGMNRDGTTYDADAAHARMVTAVRALETDGVELLLENLPPYPWYFGGRWRGEVMCSAASVLAACRDAGVGLCFDTSHAALACAAYGASLDDFADAVRPIARHLHVSDAIGTGGEGLQIGEGAINFASLLPRILSDAVTLVPEVWMGHHDDGEGFLVGLRHLSDVRWAARAVERAPDAGAIGELATLVVPDTATIFGALRVIDANRMGIAFVVDADRRVVGVVTDGDLRHAFVRGRGLHTPVRDVMNRDFVHGTPGMSRDEIRARLPGRTRVMPVINEQRRLVDVANLWTVGDAER